MNNIYTLYNSNKMFVNNLKKYIQNEFGLNKIWNENITDKNKYQFLDKFSLLNNRIKYYEYQINNFYGTVSNNNKKIEYMNNQTHTLDNVKIVMNQFFNNKEWLKYWQIFGLTLLILDKQIDLSTMKNIYDKYSYDLFNKINNIIYKNYDKFNLLINKCNGATCIDFFRYEQQRYCSKNIVNNLANAMGKEIHQLNTNQKNRLDKECSRYSNGTNEKEACTSKMLCEFVIYAESKKELNKIDYTSMIEKITGYILLYYLTLIQIYTQITERMQQSAYNQQGIIWSQEDYKILNNLKRSQYAYYQ